MISKNLYRWVCRMVVLPVVLNWNITLGSFASEPILNQMFDFSGLLQDIPGIPPVDEPDRIVVPLVRQSKRDWRICNLSIDPLIKVAYVLHAGGKWINQGWQDVKRNECFIASEDLKQKHGLYYAKSDRRVWAGSLDRCVNPDSDFSHAKEACGEGMAVVPFVTVELSGNVSVTTNISE